MKVIFQNKRMLKQDKGFSIVELLIVLVFMTTIISGILPLFAKAISVNKANKNKLYAYQTANAEIENMRNTPYLDLANYSFTIPGLSTATGTVVLSDVIDGSPQVGIVEATVTVTWPYKSKSESIEIVTYIAEQGMGQ